MKKIGNIIYVAAGLLICAMPCVGMTFHKTTTSTENRTRASFPEVKKEGKLNTKFFSEFDDYFNDNFAFRNELVSADAQIQSKVFKVSNVDTVVTGSDGWLYYTDTVDDYLGEDVLNDRQINSAAYNISLLQAYVENKGSQFIFTVAPNKNSLYGENMPYYYSYKDSEEKNIDKLEKALEKYDVKYVDSFEIFENTDETLYLKRDSHWNNKGAALVYNKLLNSIEKEHDTFETVSVTRTKTETGDLGSMMYPLGAETEWNYYYDIDAGWSYTSKEKDVTAASITTEGKNGEGSLLMFRDSFGNSLLPFMANAFETASFSKVVPYRVEDYLSQEKVDVVIVEKVERNLDEFVYDPPVMTAPEITLDKAFTVSENEAGSLEIGTCEFDTNYVYIKGEAKDSWGTNGKFYISISNGDKTQVYQAYSVSTENSDMGYLAYFSKSELTAKGFAGDDVTVSVIAFSKKKNMTICSSKLIY